MTNKSEKRAPRKPSAPRVSRKRKNLSAEATAVITEIPAEPVPVPAPVPVTDFEPVPVPVSVPVPVFSPPATEPSPAPPATLSRRARRLVHRIYRRVRREALSRSAPMRERLFKQFPRLASVERFLRRVARL